MTQCLTAELAEIAREQGAAGFGVTPARPFERERAALLARSGSGHSGPLHFTYDDPDLATDITVSFPWAISLVVVGWNYLGSSRGPAPTGAIVGRFATADHYPDVRRVTGGLAARLREEGHRAEVLIDDNRLVDRAAAVGSGVGWWGKSTMTLVPGHGPWTLLGSVVTDAHLTTSSPMRRDCGTCVACIPACPTNALGEGVLDARRCLSTWLQTAGSIPHWIRPRLGRRIYGCDDCLTACPPGKRALAGAEEKQLSLPFDRFLALEDEGLLQRFSWWYVPRRDGRYLRRNLLVAAGNSKEPGALRSIRGHMSHPSSMIRSHAAWALGRSLGSRAVTSLRAALETETAPETRDELSLALLMVEDPAAYESVLAAEEWARSTPVRGLALVEDEQDIRLLVIGGDHGARLPPYLDGIEAVYWSRHELFERARFHNVVRVYDPDRILADLLRVTRLEVSGQV